MTIYFSTMTQHFSINCEFLMKPEESAECDQTLFVWVGSGNETRKRGGRGKGGEMGEEEEEGRKARRRGQGEKKVKPSLVPRLSPLAPTKNKNEAR